MCVCLITSLSNKSKQVYRSECGLWRIKMKTLLVHQGFADAIMVTSSKEDVKKVFQEIEVKAHSAIVLSLGDEVLREVADKESALKL
uniref:Uncharacterized protein n=1 Tax=Cannabis sativa TaxID=3483 RepID=A0A803PZS3_CANSA